MTTLVQANGTWNATPAALCRWHLAARRLGSDPAGNVGRATQTLTVTGELACA